MIEERRSMTGIALRWSHLIIALIVYLVTIGALYGTLKTQAEDTAKRVEQKVDHSEFEQMLERLASMDRHLENIDNKIDRRTELQELQRVYDNHGKQ